MNRIEYKLLLRRIKLNLKKVSNYFFKNYQGFFNLIIAVAGLYFAFHSNQLTAQGNTLSNAAYTLAKNDTSQQAQIGKLTDILDTIQEQNKIARIQTNQLKDILNKIKEQNDNARAQTNHLIEIATASKAQDLLTTKLILGVGKQLDINNQQLLLSKKSDSATSLQSTLQRQTDILNFISTFDQINNLRFQDKIRHIDSLNYNETINLIHSMKDILEKGFSNRLVLTDSIIGFNWLRYYLLLRQEENNLPVVSPFNYPTSNFPYTKWRAASFYMYYKEFRNPLGDRIDKLQLQVNKNFGRYSKEDGGANFYQH